MGIGPTEMGETLMTAYILIDRLVLCRSDTGDGGWSLHPSGSTDENIASGDARCLASGFAEQTDSGWSRPNLDDYRAAAMSDE